MVKGWGRTTIGEFIDFKNGLNKGKAFFGVGTPIVNYMDVYKKRGIHSGDIADRVTLSNDEIKRFEVRKGDVFFTRTSETPEEVGYPSVMLDDVSDCVFSGFILRGRPKNAMFDIEYCKYAFFTPEIRKAIMSSCTYTTRALTNGQQLSVIEIPIPPMLEQRAIATAISDVDAYIAVLEKLITKKQAILHGVMQELLTGKRRLSGFDGEWKERPLSNYGHCVRGVSYNPSNDLLAFERIDSFILLRANNIVDGKIVYRNLQYVQNRIVSTEQLLNAGDIVIAMSSGSVVAVGKSAPYIGKSKRYCVGAFCAIFRSVDNPYIRFLFQSSAYRKMLFSVLEGTSINNLNGKIIGDLTFMFPPSRVEQDAIVSILIDMDAEIDTLMTKLEKMRNLKQGMMSELLAGRIRLVESKTTDEMESEQQTQPKFEQESANAKTAIVSQKSSHNQRFDDAVMIAGIVNAFYSDKYPLGRKKVQKLLYLLRRHQNESTVAFKKKAAGPYADEVRYKGGEPIAKRNGYITTTIVKGKGTTFARGKKLSQAIDYIQQWDKQADIEWLFKEFRYTKVDELELLATVDMAICDLTEAGIPISVESIKHLIATNKEWRDKLKKQVFADNRITEAIRKLQALL